MRVSPFRIQLAVSFSILLFCASPSVGQQSIEARVDHIVGAQMRKHQVPVKPETVFQSGVAIQQVPATYNAFAYIVEGEGLFGAEGERAGDGQMVMFAQDGDAVRIENPLDAKATFEVLLIAGVPLHEPVARYGPFVMNTEAEIRQAIEGFRQGRMGAISA